MSEKLFILDTSVWMSGVDTIADLKGKIIVPFTVLEELDYCKDSRLDNKRFRAMQAIHMIKAMTAEDKIIFYNDDHIEPSAKNLDKSIYNDLKLIATAKEIQSKEYVPVEFMTNDLNLFIRAQVEGLSPLEAKQDTASQGYTGFRKSKKKGEFSLPSKHTKNQFFVHKDGIFREKAGEAIQIKMEDFAEGGKVGNIFGTAPLNEEQAMALNLLLDDDIDLVTIAGKAGSGKTIITTAVGLHTTEKYKYTKTVLVKPIIEVGKEMGFLPGDVNSKIAPHITPFVNSIEMLCYLNGITDYHDFIASKRDTGALSFECISYFRGITIHRTFLVIDEAQNLSEHEIKTILTRAGHGTKVILLADVDQIDNKYLNRYNNGFSFICNRFMNQPNYGHITLQKSERSALAEQAADLLG